MKRNYSIGLKESILKKVSGQGSQRVIDVSKDTGVPPTTIHYWRKQMNEKIETKLRLKNYSNKEKFELLLKYYSLEAEARGSFLREQGLYLAEIESWKKEFTAEKVSGCKVKNSKEIKRIKELEKELRRKDKALAEASALLILKKKLNEYWGIEEDRSTY